MKWLKAVFSFVLKHLPRWIHVVHEVAKDMGECPVCEAVPEPCRDCDLYEDCRARQFVACNSLTKGTGESPDSDEVTDPCRDCDLYEDCKWFDEQVKGGI